MGWVGEGVWARSTGSEHEGGLALGKEMRASGGVGAEEGHELTYVLCDPCGSGVDSRWDPVAAGSPGEWG